MPAKTKTKKPAAKSATAKTNAAAKKPATKKKRTPDVLKTIKVVAMLPTKGNPRKITNESVADLRLSVREHGRIITAPLVRPAKKHGFYEICAGHRRHRAAKLEGIKEIECIVREMDDDEFFATLLTENLQREDVDVAMEAAALRAAIDKGLDPAELSARLGKGPSWVRRRMKLLDLAPPLWAKWQVGNMDGWTLGALELLAAQPEALQIKAYEFLGGRWGGVNRQKLQGCLDSHFMARLDSLPFKLSDKRFFEGKCGASCLCSSAAQSDLFEDVAPEARCLNLACYHARAAKWLAVKLAEIDKRHGGELLPYLDPNTHKPWFNDTVSDRGTVCFWSHEEAKKGAKGAVPVINLANPFNPKVVWWILAKSGGSSSTGSNKKTPAEKREAFQRKRWVLAHAKLIEAFEAFAQPKQAVVLALASSFGTASMRAWTSDAGPWELLKEDSKAHTKRLWLDTVDVMGRRITNNDGVGGITRDMIAEMKRLAEWIEFDLAAAKREADLAVPAPRSWGEVDPHTLEPVKLPGKGRKVPAKASKKKAAKK